MATDYTIINTIKVTNVSNQRLAILVKTPTTSSLIFTKSGMISINSEGSLEVEEYRLDLQQLNNMANNKMITYERLKRKVEITTTGTTGSSGS